MPAILTTQVPAELIVFDGPPDFVPLAGTALKWASNTRSDVLQDSATGAYYVLLAGRWFRAPALTGPWTFVASDALPADFARIPPMSLAGAVLPAVAGTPQAKVALIENTIPQTASVPLKGGPAFTATFDGAAAMGAHRRDGAELRAQRGGAGAAHRARCVLRGAGGDLVPRDAAERTVERSPPRCPTRSTRSRRRRPSSTSRSCASTAPTPTSRSWATRPAISVRSWGPSRTVVYGTGFASPGWIGNAWYPGPATYGVAATPVYNPRVGYAYAFAMGLVPAASPGGAGRGRHAASGLLGPLSVLRGDQRERLSRVGAAAGGGRTRKRARRRRPPRRDRCRAAGRRRARRAPSAAPAPSTAPPPFAPPAPTPDDTRIAGRGYDMSMVTTQDNPPVGGAPKPAAAGGTPYISANAYYASLRANGGWDPAAASNHTYAAASGAVYRNSAAGWQQQAGNGWQPAPAAPPEVDAEAQARARADAAAQAAGSYGMSNATRFTGQPGDGWTRRDAGSGGYSRTLGGDGGISAEYANYRDAVQNNAFDIAMNGGYWGDSVAVGNSSVSVGVGVGV